MVSKDVAVPPAAEQPKAVAIPEDKALTNQQLKNLGQIVENDFADLRERVAYELKQQHSRKRQEVQDKFADQTKVEKARAAIDKAVEKAQQTINDAVAKIDRTAVEVNDGAGLPYRATLRNFIAPSYTVPGLDTALRTVDNAYQRLRDASHVVINRRYRESQRQVLLAGVTSSTAADLINNFPNAATIIQEVKTEMEDSLSDELTALGLS